MVEKHTTRKPRKPQSKQPPRSTAPPPIKPVGERPLLRLPESLPRDYPDILKNHTEGWLTMAAGAGYTRQELVLCCKELLDVLDPGVYAAVYEGLTPHVAQEAVRGLIYQIICENRATEDEHKKAARQVRESWPWRKLVQGIEEASQQRARDVQRIDVQRSSSPVVDESEPGFEFLGDDSRQIRWRGVVHTLAENQFKIIKVLYDAYKKGGPVVPKERLLAAVGSPRAEVRSFFRDSPLWNDLIIKGERRGTYRLNLPPLKHRPN
jgi:hypothetical protein